MTDPGAVTIRARFDDEAFDDDLARFDPESPARRVAQAARSRYQRDGVAPSELWNCSDEGRDGTQLAGRVKVYLPPEERAPRFRMIFTPIWPGGGVILVYLAFGVGHQPRGSRAPSGYAIAHRRAHGAWPRRP